MFFAKQSATRAFGTRSNPGILHRAFNVVDRNTTAYGISKFDPVSPLTGHNPLPKVDEVGEYNITNLSNGFSVLTESEVFPGSVHMGFLMDVGTRDETAETSGAMLAL